MTPWKIAFVALPRILGPMTAKLTLTMASRKTTMIRGASGRSRASSRPNEPRKSFDFSAGIPTARNGPLANAGRSLTGGRAGSG